MGLYPKEFAALHPLPRSKRKTKKKQTITSIDNAHNGTKPGWSTITSKGHWNAKFECHSFSAFIDLGPASPSQPQASILWSGLRQHESEDLPSLVLCGFPQPWEGLVGVSIGEKNTGAMPIHCLVDWISQFKLSPCSQPTKLHDKAESKYQVGIWCVQKFQIYTVNILCVYICTLGNMNTHKFIFA